MNLKFRCPHCDIRLTVAAHKAGQMSRCPQCRTALQIPAAAGDLVSIPAAETTTAGGSADQPPPTNSAMAATAPAAAAAERPGDERVSPLSRPQRPSPHVPAEFAGTMTAESLPTAADPLPTESTWSPASSVAADGLVQLPRWVIYSQAGLLVIVAATFFVLGLLARSGAGHGGAESAVPYPCQLTGTVQIRRGESLVPDAGAVVIVLPVDQTPVPRPEPRSLRPDSFQPLDNPAIEQIEGLGGRVVRINAAGAFDLTLPGPREYQVLIVSRAATRSETGSISKAQTAAIGRYFFPVEELLGSQAFYWGSLKLNRQSQALPAVTF